MEYAHHTKTEEAVETVDSDVERQGRDIITYRILKRYWMTHRNNCNVAPIINLGVAKGRKPERTPICY